MFVHPVLVVGTIGTFLFSCLYYDVEIFPLQEARDLFEVLGLHDAVMIARDPRYVVMVLQQILHGLEGVAARGNTASTPSSKKTQGGNRLQKDRKRAILKLRFLLSLALHHFEILSPVGAEVEEQQRRLMAGEEV